ncbi:hypothetical protein CLV67_118171 [Actinoplanes italicus]|uniref:SET domain-containing protein n=1 Tax=Actinoplanes italicus TaxID=113567 RepID=A0A2T0K2K2_9ACTN|nr:hypothetical protein CLV67_118171 [Actinoplanes italicus]
MTLGPGGLAGTGVYAARDFAVGEVVVDYELQPLDEAGYLALPPGEHLFVHSYGGRRHLYPAPARFVNHADDPSCYQDFDRGCDVALRPIARGEPITIDATQETARELSTFLDAYRGRDLAPLVDSEAVLWLSGRVFRGREAVVAVLFDEPEPALDAVEWMVGTGRWEAACSAVDGDRHLTMLLKVIRGNWQMVYQHRG